MDNTLNYSEAVKQIIVHYAKLRPSHGNIRLDPVFDDTHQRYSLMQTGWDQGRRIRGNIIYITIQNDKVFIEYDGLEHGIINDLVKAGIPEKQIILAYLPEMAA
ncbi:XisI protein [candidate division KSB1 bacterium]|nr:XisI protein [candidate division KSB1 bacterium]